MVDKVYITCTHICYFAITRAMKEQNTIMNAKHVALFVSQLWLL